MQAVGFGIERDAIGRVDLLQQLRQPGIACNNVRHPITAIRSKAILRSFWSRADCRSVFPSTRVAEVLTWFCAASVPGPIHQDDKAIPHVWLPKAADGWQDTFFFPAARDRDATPCWPCLRIGYILIRICCCRFQSTPSPA